MKKLISVLLLAVLAVSMVSCAEDPSVKSEGVMTYAEYKAAAIDSEVVIEAYVQATQSWWDDKITVYLADPDGAYFVYEMACSEENAKKLTKGTKIKVSGVKAEWSGEVEIMEPTFEFGNSVTWVAEATDLTDLLGKDELVDHQNELALFKDLTVKEVSYKGDARGDDIYLKLTKAGVEYDFCVERYLTDPDSGVYQAVEALVPGDVVDVEGFLYWYNGPNTHITGVTKK